MSDDYNIDRCYFLPIFAGLVYVLISINPVKKALEIAVPNYGIRVTTCFFIIVGLCFIFCRIMDIIFDDGHHF